MKHVTNTSEHSAAPEQERTIQTTITHDIMPVHVPARWEAKDDLAAWSQTVFAEEQIAMGAYRAPRPIRDRTKLFPFS